MIIKIRWRDFALCAGLFFISQQATAQSVYQKSKTLYFTLDSIGINVPYERGTPNVYLKDDSLLYDLRFNKFSRRLIVTHYKRKDYYSKGYAPPQAVVKYKTSKAQLDTVRVESPVTGKTVYSIHKRYTTKLLDRIDYFKYKSK